MVSNKYRPSDGGKKATRKTARPLILAAALVSLASLVAYGAGTHFVVNRLVVFEGSQIGQQWSLAFAHMLEARTDLGAEKTLTPYGRALPREELVPLDTAIFEGEIIGYRVYGRNSVIVASSSFEEIGRNASNPNLTLVLEDGRPHAHLTSSMPTDGEETISTALAALNSKGNTIGALEIRVDLSARMAELQKLRLVVFLALLALLGLLMGILGIVAIRLLNEQRRVQDELTISEQQHRKLLDDGREAIVISDRDTILYANTAAAVMHGADSPDALIGLDPLQLVPEQHRETVRRYRTEALGENGVRQSDSIGRCTLDGRLIDSHNIGAPVEWNGKSCILVRAWDISPERAAQRAVAESEARLSAFLNHSLSPMYLKDMNLEILMTNKAFVDFYKTHGRDLEGTTVHSIADESAAAQIELVDREVLRTGMPMSLEIDVIGPDGETRDIVFEKFPIFDADGNVSGVGGVNSDITEARQQDRAIIESESQLTAFLNHAPLMTVLLDPEFRLIRTNDAYDAFFGINGMDYIGSADRPWLSEDLTEQYIDEARTIIETAAIFDRFIEMVDTEGQVHQFRQVKFPIDDGKGRLIAIGLVMTDITEQVLQSHEMAVARDEAEAANRAKSAFLANMSHEIRTPMNGVLGMADLLSLSSLTPDQHRYLDTIRRSGEALLGIINNILDVSRIEAGEFRLNAVSFDLHELTADTLEILAETASTKGIVIAHHISNNVPPHVIGDDVRLRQVLLNLLGNALKFTTEGEVVIRMTKVGGDAENPLIRFEVTDTGIGIAQDQQSSLFDAFNQADDSITRRYGGTGLGLSIAQHIVHLMGGRIDVDSAPDDGSAFVFSVPLRADTSAELSDTLPPASLSGKRVLIVDDTPTNREILEEFTAGWGMESVTATSGADACALIEDSIAQNEQFDFALLDIAMPGMDGVALANWIRADRRCSGITLIGLTSFNLNRDNDEFQSAGFSEFVTKPVRRSHLMKTIAGVRDPSSIKPAAPSASPAQVSQNEPVDAPPPATSPRRATILLAEDNLVNQEVGRQYLIRDGYSVHTANNGVEAVEAFQQGNFDLVLMDVQMPEMDGIRATAVIREFEKSNGLNRVPIIAATAHAFQDDRDKCIAAGMDDFLSKPYTRKELHPLLNRWLPSDAISTMDVAGNGGGAATPETETDTESAPNVLDEKVLDQLRSMNPDNSNQILKKVVGLFLESTPPQLAQLSDSVTTEDFDTLGQISHGLKSSAANVAAIDLSNLFRELEKAVQKEDAALSGELVIDIHREFAEVSRALATAAAEPTDLQKSA